MYIGTRVMTYPIKLERCSDRGKLERYCLGKLRKYPFKDLAYT